MPTLELTCLALPDNNPDEHIVVIHIDNDAIVAELKQSILDMYPNRLAHVDIDDLVLWKCAMPFETPDETFNTIRFDGTDKRLHRLECPISPTREHFVTCSKFTIQVLVEVPNSSECANSSPNPSAAGPRGKTNITPTEKTLDITAIDIEIRKELKSLHDVVENFLRNPEPPAWVPPDYVTPDNREFLTSLRIPSDTYGRPDLLLHYLDKCDAGEIKKIFGYDTHLCICDASGSGKTKRIMQGLTKYWGFYFVAIPDYNGVGVSDLKDTLDNLHRYHFQEWVSDITSLPLEQRAAQDELNNQIVSRCLRKVLATRIVVFKLFLDLAIVIDGGLQEKHKRLWLLFQSTNQPDPWGTPHPFVRIIKRCLCYASDEALDLLIKPLDDIRKNLLQDSHFIFALDEAHRAARLHRYAFISASNPQVNRSIIHEIAKVFTKYSIKLVVSGKNLFLSELEEATASGGSERRLNCTTSSGCSTPGKK